MNSFPLTTFWLQILALIAAEIAVISLILMLAQRSCRTAAWRRTLCQAGLVSCLLIVGSEFSGAGRALTSWIWKLNGEALTNPAEVSPSSHRSAPEIPEKKRNLEPAFRSKVMEQLARNQSVLNSDPSHVAQLPPSKDWISRSSDAKRSFPVTDSTVIRLLGLVVASGAAFVAGRAGLGRLLLVLIGSRRKVARNDELSRQVDSISRNLKFSRRIRIIESPRLVSPIAFGFLQPTIGLPLSFNARFSAAKREAMLTHELAHLAAHDPLWYFLADLVAALLWWHPGVWWMRRRLQLLSELAADEASLVSADGPRVLAECLVELGAQLARPVPGQLRVAGFRSDLGCRVQRLIKLDGKQWSPISRGWILLARSVGPIALALTVILCTAWAVPGQLTKGDSMKTMKQNWQRIFATFAAMAAIQSPTAIIGQQNPPGAEPANGGVPPVNRVPAAGNPPTLLDPNASRPVRNELRARYGLPPESGEIPGGPLGRPENRLHGEKLEAKLKGIVLDEVKFEGLPLAEVLNFLGDASHKRDSEKSGVNFLINPNPPQIASSGPATIDPATGQPVPAASMEAIDVGSVIVRFNMPLRHVTMADLLDAIVRVADKPIQYTVEDYAVIFSLRPEANAIAPVGGRAPGVVPLVVRTFHVDTNTFVGGLESAFGIKVEMKGKEESQSKKIQAALKDLLVQLNVSMEGNKAIFYNELTATVMVRVAGDDLDVIQAAIQTLGGEAMGGYSIGYSPGLQGIPIRPPRAAGR